MERERERHEIVEKSRNYIIYKCKHSPETYTFIRCDKLKL